MPWFAVCFEAGKIVRSSFVVCPFHGLVQDSPKTLGRENAASLKMRKCCDLIWAA